MPYFLVLYLVWLQLLSSLTTFGYAQLWWASVNQCQSGYGLILKNAKNRSKNVVFLTISENSRRSKPLCTIKKSLLGRNILTFYKHFFRTKWFSILSLFTFKSYYKNMVLTSAFFSIGRYIIGLGVSLINRATLTS